MAEKYSNCLFFDWKAIIDTFFYRYYFVPLITCKIEPFHYSDLLESSIRNWFCQCAMLSTFQQSLIIVVRFRLYLRIQATLIDCKNKGLSSTMKANRPVRIFIKFWQFLRHRNQVFIFSRSLLLSRFHSSFWCEKEWM